MILYIFWICQPIPAKNEIKIDKKLKMVGESFRTHLAGWFILETLTFVSLGTCFSIARQLDLKNHLFKSDSRFACLLQEHNTSSCVLRLSLRGPLGGSREGSGGDRRRSSESRSAEPARHHSARRARAQGAPLPAFDPTVLTLSCRPERWRVSTLQRSLE